MSDLTSSTKVKKVKKVIKKTSSKAAAEGSGEGGVTTETTSITTTFSSDGIGNGDHERSSSVVTFALDTEQNG